MKSNEIMRTKRKPVLSSLRPLALGLSALFALSCSEDSSDFPVSGESVRVQFESPTIEELHPFTKSEPEALSEGTTVRIAAYYTGSDRPQSENFCKETTYCLREGQLVPCVVDAEGAFVEYGGQDMELLPYVYDFYAVSPALPLNDDKGTVDVPHGVDFATSATLGQTISGSDAVSMSLSTLLRKCAHVTFEIRRSDDFVGLTALSVAQLTVGGLQPTAPGIDITGIIAAADGSSSYVLPGEAFTATGETSSRATCCLLPSTGTSRITFAYDLDCTLNGEQQTQTVNGSVSSLKLEAGKSYTVTLTVKQQGGSLILTDPEIDQTTDVGGW